MKKITAILIFCTFGSLISNAQSESDFRFGFVVEPNVSWLSPKNKGIESTSSSVRFTYGLSADFLFTERYAIGTGMLINSNGGAISYLTEYNSSEGRFIARLERDLNVKYVEVPLTLKLRTNEIGYMTYWFQFGLGVKIDAKADEEYEFLYRLDESSGSTVWSTENLPARVINDAEPISSDIRTFRTSLIIGFGVEYSLSGTTALIGGITFNNGFNNVLKDDGIKQDDREQPIFEGLDPVNFDLNAISNSLRLTLGIQF